MVTIQEPEREHLARQLYTLAEIAKTLTCPLELPELLDAVMKKIIGVLQQADVGTLMLWDQSAGLFRPEAIFGFDPEVIKEIGLRAGESITGKVYEAGRACLLSSRAEVAEMVADMREANRKIYSQALGSASLPVCVIAAPLIVGEQKYGVLVLETLENNQAFSEEDMPLVQTISDLVALAIDRARLEARADVIRQAQQAERLRSEVTATLSHQLRMPLSMIKGYTTALMMDEIDWSEEKKREFLSLVDEECDTMETMIHEILDSSLIDVGQLTLEREPVRLPGLVREIALDFQRRFECHRIMIDFPADFPIVEVDPRWIKQVFRNILDNAIKYSPTGGLVLTRGEIRSNDVVIHIADQGIGISPEDLIPLFEKYFRVKTRAGTHVSGTGLGLPVARSIIEAHRGRIWAESKLGQGTTISFSLPVNHLLGEDIPDPD